MSDRMPTHYTSLEDKSVFITGGASGIGEAIVTAFVEQGAKVAFVDIMEDAGNALVEKLSKDARNAPLFIKCDLTDIPALQAAVAKAA